MLQPAGLGRGARPPTPPLTPAPLPAPPAHPLPASSAARQLEGALLLFLVAFLWGSYSPTLRLANSLPGPPSPAVLAAARGFLQLLVLLLALPCGAAQVPPSADDEEAGPAARLAHAGDDGGAWLQQPLLSADQEATHGFSTCSMAPAAPVRGDQQFGQPSRMPAADGQTDLAGRPRGLQQERLPLGLPAAVLAALEIGGYNTTGTLCQTAGLAMTSATRGAFLAQASALFTPLLAACAGMAPSRAMWLSCLLGLAGTLAIAADPGAHAAHAASPGGRRLALPGGTAGAAGLAGTEPAPTPLGDALIIAAAACYSAATVRIPAWAVRHRVPALQLTLGKSTLLAAASSAALALVAAHAAREGQPLAALWPGWRQPQAWGLILWSALGPGALSTFLHVKGQSLVSPTAAQIVFASVPLWSALLAAVALPGEAVSRGTWLGGALIAAAGLVAALAQRRRAPGTPA